MVTAPRSSQLAVRMNTRRPGVFICMVTVGKDNVLLVKGSEEVALALSAPSNPGL